MQIDVIVGVAKTRPPKVDEYSKIQIAIPEDCADNLLIAENYARLLAIYIATAKPGVVMAVSAEIDRIEL